MRSQKRTKLAQTRTEPLLLLLPYWLFVPDIVELVDLAFLSLFCVGRKLINNLHKIKYIKIETFRTLALYAKTRRHTVCLLLTSELVSCFALEVPASAALPDPLAPDPDLAAANAAGVFLNERITAGAAMRENRRVDNIV
jgi:hypothetical protein